MPLYRGCAFGFICGQPKKTVHVFLHFWSANAKAKKRSQDESRRQQRDDCHKWPGHQRDQVVQDSISGNRREHDRPSQPAQTWPKPLAPPDTTRIAPPPDLRTAQAAEKQSGPALGDADAPPGSAYSLRTLDMRAPDDLKVWPDPRDAMKELRDLIASAEARKGGYNAYYGYGFSAYPAPGKDISKMSVGEVKAFQEVMKTNPGNKDRAPVGRYQFVPTTLSELLKELDIPDTAIFDSALQDRLADRLLIRAGFDRYQQGRISAETFQAELAKKWAVIAMPGRKTTYRDDIHPDPAPIQGPVIQDVISGKNRYRY